MMAMMAMMTISGNGTVSSHAGQLMALPGRAGGCAEATRGCFGGDLASQ
jgi:hypothetical protein